MTPPGYIGALEGITRNAIIEIARELGYEVKEEPFTRHDVYTAEEVFLTGTAAEVIAVVKLTAARSGTANRESTQTGCLKSSASASSVKG